MTPTDEELLALADRADSWDRCWPGNLNLEKLVADLSAALRVIVAERQKPHTYVGGEASVAVCPICDIAGCHHIRDAERQKPQHGKEVMPNDEDNSHERPAVSPRLTAGAQAIRDKALDEAAQAVSNRAAYWWDASTAADDTGRKKLSLIFESKALACTENAAAIRAMKGKPE